MHENFSTNHPLFCSGFVFRTISFSINWWNAGSNHFSNSRSLSQYSLILPCSKQVLILRSHPIHSLSLTSGNDAYQEFRKKESRRRSRQQSIRYWNRMSFIPKHYGLVFCFWITILHLWRMQILSVYQMVTNRILAWIVKKQFEISISTRSRGTPIPDSVRL